MRTNGPVALTEVNRLGYSTCMFTPCIHMVYCDIYSPPIVQAWINWPVSDLGTPSRFKLAEIISAITLVVQQQFTQLWAINIKPRYIPNQPRDHIRCT